jgi:hypothetical protein
MNKGGFSWKRATGVTRAKLKVSRSTGIPLTKSGRQRKVGRAVTGGGCLLPVLLVGLVFGLAGCTQIPTTPTAGPTVAAPTADPHAAARAHILATLDQVQAISDSMKGGTDDQVVTGLGALDLLFQDESHWLASQDVTPPAMQVYSTRLAGAWKAVGAAVGDPTVASITAAGNAVTSLLGCRDIISNL